MLSRTGAALGMVNGKDKMNIKESIERSQDFPIAQMVKNLPTMQETWVRSLGQVYPLDLWDINKSDMSRGFTSACALGLALLLLIGCFHHHVKLAQAGVLEDERAH